MVYMLADALKARSVPIVFATGYDRGAIPEPYADIPYARSLFSRSRSSGPSSAEGCRGWIVVPCRGCHRATYDKTVRTCGSATWVERSGRPLNRGSQLELIAKFMAEIGLTPSMQPSLGSDAERAEAVGFSRQSDELIAKRWEFD
jgi:hypothetical protein